MLPCNGPGSSLFTYTRVMACMGRWHTLCGQHPLSCVVDSLTHQACGACLLHGAASGQACTSRMPLATISYDQATRLSSPLHSQSQAIVWRIRQDLARPPHIERDGLPADQLYWHHHAWTHWDLNPGPSACEADVMPLHHVPHVCTFTSRQGTCNYVWASGLRP